MTRRFRRLLFLATGVLVVLLVTWFSGFLGGSSGDGTDGEDPDEPRTGRLVGRVRAASGGPPPPGTRVIARGPHDRVEARADSGGSFRFEDLPEGASEVEAVVGPLRVAVPLESFSGELVLPDVFTVAGLVVETIERSGRPEASAVVGAEVTCGEQTARTDERGRFRIEGVAAAGGLQEMKVRSAEHLPLDHRPGKDAAWDDLYLTLIRR